MAPGFGRFIPCDTSPISISAILGPTRWLSSSRKLPTLRHYRNRHRRAQPSGWLYTSTTQCLTRSGAIKTIDICRTTWWKRHPCRLLMRRVDTPQREPLACSRAKTTFIVPVICHTQRGWLFPVWYPRVIAMARMTRTPQQGRHHALIPSQIYPQTLLLGSSILRALPIRQTNSRITPNISTERIELTWFTYTRMAFVVHYVNLVSILTRSWILYLSPPSVGQLRNSYQLWLEKAWLSSTNTLITTPKFTFLQSRIVWTVIFKHKSSITLEEVDWETNIFTIVEY